MQPLDRASRPSSGRQAASATPTWLPHTAPQFGSAPRAIHLGARARARGEATHRRASMEDIRNWKLQIAIDWPKLIQIDFPIRMLDAAIGQGESIAQSRKLIGKSKFLRWAPGAHRHTNRLTSGWW
ncbi:MAG: hypothetical protein ACK4PM_15680, partial [Acinetobacter junii]